MALSFTSPKFVLPDAGALTRAELEEAMKEHVIARAELVGTYQKMG